MRRWPRLRPRTGHGRSTPAPPPEDPGSALPEPPARLQGRHWTELAYFSKDLTSPWSSVHVTHPGTIDAGPGADDPVAVTATIAIYHANWYSTEFREPPYRYLQRGEDESWAVRRVDGDENTGYRPGAVERRFTVGRDDLVLDHILGLWSVLPGEREAEDERRRQYWRSRDDSP